MDHSYTRLNAAQSHERQQERSPQTKHWPSARSHSGQLLATSRRRASPLSRTPLPSSRSVQCALPSLTYAMVGTCPAAFEIARPCEESKPGPSAVRVRWTFSRRPGGVARWHSWGSGTPNDTPSPNFFGNSGRTNTTTRNVDERMMTQLRIVVFVRGRRPAQLGAWSTGRRFRG